MVNAANVKKLLQEHQAEVSKLKETEESLRDEIESLK
jgi:cell division protein FtsB